MFPLKTEEQYQQQALSRLPEQFKGQERWAGFLLALAGQHQDAEAAIYTLFTGRQLATAVGAALDQYGAIVGQERGSLDDTSYRLRIRARLILNRSSGTIPEILNIFSLLTDLELELQEYPPAAFELRFSGGELELPTDFAAILSAARAAGVGANLLYQLDLDEESFSFASGPGLGFPAVGYGEFYNIPPREISSTSSPGPPLLGDIPPDLVPYPLLLTISVTSVVGSLVNFTYRVNHGPAIVASQDTTDSGLPLEDEDGNQLYIILAFQDGEPYTAGDSWEWEFTFGDGGRLVGVIGT